MPRGYALTEQQKKFIEKNRHRFPSLIARELGITRSVVAKHLNKAQA